MALYWGGKYWSSNYWASNYWGGAVGAASGKIWSTNYWAAHYWQTNYWGGGAGAVAGAFWGSRYWQASYWASHYWRPVSSGQAQPSGVNTALDGVSGAILGTFIPVAAASGVVAAAVDGVSASFIGTIEQLQLFDLTIGFTPIFNSIIYPSFNATLGTTLDDSAGVIRGSFIAQGARSGPIGTQLDGVVGAFSGTHVGPVGRIGILGPVLDGASSVYIGAVFQPGSSLAVAGAQLADSTAAFLGNVTVPVFTGSFTVTLDDTVLSSGGISVGPGALLGIVQSTLDALSCGFVGSSFLGGIPRLSFESEPDATRLEAESESVNLEVNP